MERINSFPPIITDSCQRIILGTMPGKQSLKKNEYYGHGGNRFWEVITELLGGSVYDDYKSRCSILLSNGIALWDVLESCERESSLDKDIRNPVPNDFGKLFRQYPKIQTIIFNGNPPYEQYNALVGDYFGKRIVKAPTTSGFSRIHYASAEAYYKDWKAILKAK